MCSEVKREAHEAQLLTCSRPDGQILTYSESRGTLFPAHYKGNDAIVLFTSLRGSSTFFWQQNHRCVSS